MRSLTGRIQRLNDFFESPKWEMFTNNLLRLIAGGMMLWVLLHLDTFIAVWKGSPS